MGESIGMKITIGGELPADLIEQFLTELKDDLYEITGPTTEAELRREAGKHPIDWFATSNYGECESLKSFCENNNLSYIHQCEAKYEYDGEVSYWIPGMKQEVSCKATQDGDLTVKVDQIRPLVLLLLEYAKMGDKALPLFISVDYLKDLVEKGLKYPKKFLPSLEKTLQKLLPGTPNIPTFKIKEEYQTLRCENLHDARETGQIN
jgi:hypothetical protein